MLTFALLLLLGTDDFASGKDPDRTSGDSWLTKPGDRNPFASPKLGDVGHDALRFSTTPALRGGERNVVTITRGEKGEAVASLDTVRYQCNLSQTRCRLVPERSPNFAFCLQGDCTYAGIARRVRALLFDPARMPNKDSAELVICTDGPGYLTELREAGRTYNLSGFCAPKHPNNVVYKLIREGVGTRWRQIGGEE
ncbi:hypothetical protein [Sphingomonas kyeonggiensis]|uniref:Uncharacterized protein n=1 Tax=Sphingomonas kyeonggiensis TaxID=1268553 RepID=A0A7W6JQX8_9SPHN|nr:hypothetical protein [Sphingomonas kyeonggiensis]MBB4097858.1 hypothetical protein [Sphingomonas kyeonggiensis]